MIDELRQRLQILQRTTGIDGDPGVLPLGLAAVDDVLGGGLARGALHEIAALSEAHLPAASGFVLGLSSLGNASSPLPWGEVDARSAAGEGLRSIESHLPPHPASLREADLSPKGRGERKKHLVWIAEDMALAESGAPYGPGLDTFGLQPERLLSVAVAHRRDLMWAMEEALRCRAVGAVIGEMRHGALDPVAVRRLSLAATQSGALAFLLRAQPAHDASTAATRWVVGGTPSTFAARNDSPGAPRFAVELIRNRRGPSGAWILEWRNTDEHFVLATHAQPVAAPLRHRPRQKVA